MSTPSEIIIKTKNFEPNDVTFMTPKVNTRGGKSVQLQIGGKPIHLSIPLMFNWGVNERVDETSGRVSYDLGLVFENEKSAAVADFCGKLKQMQDIILTAASSTHSKEWFGKPKLSFEVAEAMMYPILKYPKDKTTEEIDYSRNPTIKLKIPFWENKFNLELFDWEGKQTFAANQESGDGPQGDKTPLDLVPSKSHIKGLISCTGLWMAGGRFGVTWKLVQARVKNPVCLIGMGVCHLESDSDDDELMGGVETKEPEPNEMNSNLEDSNDEEEEEKVEVAVADKPKKKVVRRKKTVTAEATG
jgi:hypothetical protein